jgi:hypothetical protein
MEEIIVSCLGFLLALVIWAAIGFFVSWVLMLAWNALVPVLLHGPSVTYDMACAIYFVITLIGTAFKTTITTTSKD